MAREEEAQHRSRGGDKQHNIRNLRVQDIDGLLKKLEEAGCASTPSGQDEDHGRFARVYHPEGYKSELWEPKEKRWSRSHTRGQPERTPLRHPLA